MKSSATINLVGETYKPTEYFLRDTRVGQMPVAHVYVKTWAYRSNGILMKSFWRCSVWGDAAAEAAKIGVNQKVMVTGELREPNVWQNSQTGEQMITQQMHVIAINGVA